MTGALLQLNGGRVARATGEGTALGVGFGRDVARAVGDGDRGGVGVTTADGVDWAMAGAAARWLG